jgi:hypothetical protein
MIGGDWCGVVRQFSNIKDAKHITVAVMAEKVTASSHCTV